MDMNVILEVIGSVGFPIACVIGLGWFIYKFYTDYTADSKEREEKLFEEIRENREINGKFAEIIARYETKLDEIITDVKEIKEDVIEMKTQK